MLLPSPNKSNPAVLIRIALLLLAGRWLDLYIIVTPTAFPDAPPLGLWEIAPPLAVLGGLPMAHRWDATWMRIVQAGLALYAAFVSFGLASYWVGIILHGVNVFKP